MWKPSASLVSEVNVLEPKSRDDVHVIHIILFVCSLASLHVIEVECFSLRCRSLSPAPPQLLGWQQSWSPVFSGCQHRTSVYCPACDASGTWWELGKTAGHLLTVLLYTNMMKCTSGWSFMQHKKDVTNSLSSTAFYRLNLLKLFCIWLNCFLFCFGLLMLCD